MFSVAIDTPSVTSSGCISATTEPSGAARPSTRPESASTAHGWQIEDHERIEVAGELRVNELVVSLGGETAARSLLVPLVPQDGTARRSSTRPLDRLLGRLLHDRADGSLVRVSTRIVDGDRDSARSRLLAFDRSFDAVLAAHWPREARRPRRDWIGAGRADRDGRPTRFVEEPGAPWTRRSGASRNRSRREAAWARAPRGAGPRRRSPDPARSGGPAPG